MKTKATIFFVILLALGGGYYFFGTSPDHKEFHEHADIKIYLEGNLVDLSQKKYQSNEDQRLDPSVHLHDNNGDIVHAHEKGITLNRFFTSLDMQFTDVCFVLDTNEQYCSDENNTLQLYVNGKEQRKMERYIFDDLDQILIFYGNKVGQLVESVTDRACIYSAQCPERGEAPEEGCVTGGGCTLYY